MVAQPPRRSHHDMHAVLQLAAFAARVHAADTGDHPRAGIVIEPAQLALHLQRQFAGGGDDERERHARRPHGRSTLQQRVGDRQAVSRGLSRTGLGRDEQVAALGFRVENRRLNRGRFAVFAFGQRAGDGGRRGVKGQGVTCGLLRTAVYSLCGKPPEAPQARRVAAEPVNFEPACGWGHNREFRISGSEIGLSAEIFPGLQPFSRRNRHSVNSEFRTP